jgi:hypothetical protein
MELRLTNLRHGPFGSVLGFADLVLDEVLVVRGIALKQKSDGSDYYVQFPASKRIDRKTGETVQKNGYDVWDNHVDLALEQRDEKWTPTTAAFEIRKEIIALLLDAFLGAGSESPVSQSARGGASKPAAKANRTPAKTSARPTARRTDDATDGDEDDLPF